MGSIPRSVVALALLLAFGGPAFAQGQRPEALAEPESAPLAGPYYFSVEGRPLDRVEELGVTGSPVDVDMTSWRLAVAGTAASRPVRLTYDELQALPRVNRVSLLICPGFFEDVAEWGGVPVGDLLALAGASPSWKEIVVTSVDGFPARFSRDEVDAHVLFVALTVNGQVLPREHGFPARLVAEGILGGRWVKWISSIEVN